jgi:hypothetical protein
MFAEVQAVNPFVNDAATVIADSALTLGSGPAACAYARCRLGTAGGGQRPVKCPGGALAGGELEERPTLIRRIGGDRIRGLWVSR